MLSKPSIAHLKKLQDKSGREESGSFLVEGVKGIIEAFVDPAAVRLVVVDESRMKEADKQEVIELARNHDVSVFETSKQIYKELSGTVMPAGILAEVRMREQTLVEFEQGPILALDHITDPGNLGTMIRTAEWFGVKNILLSEGSVDVYNEKVVRSTMGSLHRLHIVKTERLLETLEHFAQKGYNITPFTLEGSPLESHRFSKKSILVFGSESHGVSDDIQTHFPKHIRISGGGETESLNVAVAAGIALHYTYTHSI